MESQPGQGVDGWMLYPKEEHHPNYGKGKIVFQKLPLGRRCKS